MNDMGRLLEWDDTEYPETETYLPTLKVYDHLRGRDMIYIKDWEGDLICIETGGYLTPSEQIGGMINSYPFYDSHETTTLSDNDVHGAFIHNGWLFVVEYEGYDYLIMEEGGDRYYNAMKLHTGRQETLRLPLSTEARIFASSHSLEV